MKKDNPKLFVPDALESHVDPMRSMMAEATGSAYIAFCCLAEAVQNDAVVILQGDEGGQIYFTCPARKIKCSETGLQRLLQYLDSKGWNDIHTASIRFEKLRIGAGVAGGMGGGLAEEEVWLHPKLSAEGLTDTVRLFVKGEISEL